MQITERVNQHNCPRNKRFSISLTIFNQVKLRIQNILVSVNDKVFTNITVIFQALKKYN